MKMGREFLNDEGLKTFTEPSSKINPLIANIFLLIGVSIVSMESNIYLLSIMLLLSVLVSFLVSRKPLQILKIMLIVVPFALGLGVFYSIVGRSEIHTAILTILLRVEVLTTSSTILYYGVDPWELPLILTSKLRIPAHLSYTIALAFTLYQRLGRDFKEITESLKSKNIIRNQLDYLFKIHKILYVLVYHAVRRAEEMEIVLEARNFNPYTRKTRKNLTIKFWDILLIVVTVAALIVVKIFLR